MNILSGTNKLYKLSKSGDRIRLDAYKDINESLLDIYNEDKLVDSWLLISRNNRSKFGKYDEIRQIKSPFKVTNKLFQKEVITTGALINGDDKSLQIRLYANRYSLDVKLDNWTIPEDFVKTLCPLTPVTASTSTTAIKFSESGHSVESYSPDYNDPDSQLIPNRTETIDTTTEAEPDDEGSIIIIFSVVGIVIIVIIGCAVIVCIYLFCSGSDGKKKEKKGAKRRHKTGPKIDTQPMDSNSGPEVPKSASESTFSVKSNVDYSKPIPLDNETPSEASIAERPTDLKL